MSKNSRIRIAKNIVFSGWLVAVMGATSILLLRLHVIDSEDQFPIWVHPFFVLGSILMLTGVLLGSRGVGLPLDKERFIKLSFGYPCWVAAVIYIGIMFISRLV